MELIAWDMPEWATKAAPDSGASAEWVQATVRSSDVSGNYSQSSPLTPFVQCLRQYVLICSALNARFCAGQVLRAYTKSKKSPNRTSSYRKRMKSLKSAHVVGAKAAEYAAYAEDIEEVVDFPVLELLRRPNPFTLGSEFLESMYFSQECTGNAFAYFDDANGGEIYNLQPHFTRLLPSETGFIEGYAYFRDTSHAVKFARELVFHTKLMPSLFDPFLGLSPLQAAMMESNLVDAATTAEWYRWKNGGRPDFAVEMQAGATEAQRKQVHAALRQELQGVHKTGNALVLTLAKVVPLGFAPKEMEYLTGMKNSNEMIWNAYGVPQSMLSLNDANLASSRTGHTQYARQTVRPRCCRMAEYLTEWFAEKYNYEPGKYWLAYDDPVPEDEASETASRTLLVNSGEITLNESRAEMGLDPYPEEIGGVPRINGVSIGKMDEPTPAPVAPTFNQSTQVEPSKADPKEQADETAKAVVSALATVRAKAIATGMIRSGCKWYGHHAHVETKDDDRLRTRRPTGVPSLVENMATALEGWYTGSFTTGAAQIADGMPASMNAADVSLNAILGEHLPLILAAAAKQGAEMVGGEWEVLPTSALNFLSGYQIRLATQITTGLQADMNDVLSRGLSEGIPTREIAAQLREVIPDASFYRAERIARTESAYVMERGRLIGWQENGVEQKEWLLSGNPCQLCEDVKAANPGPIPVDKPFFEGGWTDGMTAPAHPNCACSTAAVFTAPKEDGTQTENIARTVDGVAVPNSVLAQGE